MKKRRASMPPSAAAKPRQETQKESGYVRVQPSIEAPEADDLAPTVPPPAVPRAKAPAADAARRSRDSHVRLCSDVAPLLGRVDEVEAHDLLDEIAEECAEVDDRLSRLERASAALELHARPRPDDAASQASFDALDLCIGEVRRLRSALAGVQRAGEPRTVHHAFACELGDYLRGLCAWIHAVLSAIGQLIAELWAGLPEYLKYRARIDAAKNLHFDELEIPICHGLDATFSAGADPHVRELRCAFDVLVKGTYLLDVRLDLPVAS